VDAGEAGDIFYVWGRGGTRRRPTLRLGFGSCHFVVCGWKLLVWGGKWKPCPKPCPDICSSINHSKGSVDVIIAIELKTIRLFTSSTTNIKNQTRCRYDDSYKNLITLLQMVALANRSDTISNGGAVHVHVFCCKQFERMGDATISRGQGLGGEVQSRDWLRELRCCERSGSLDAIEL
jgi:hypothetical protein